MSANGELTLELSWHEPLKALPHIVGRLVAAKNPIKIILFGSHATGRAQRGSDLDLLVVLDRVDDLRRAAIELQNALSGLAVPVDIIVATPELTKKYRNFSGYIYKQALDEGQCVYERR